MPATTSVYTLRHWMPILAAVLALLTALSACSKKEDAPGAPREKQVVRLGYFPNVTHAPAMVGVANKDFEKALGPDVELKVSTFNAGPSVIEAIFGNQLDIAYIGPSPTLNGFIKSKGAEVVVIAGAVENGTLIVGSVKRGITHLDQLKGARIATPQLGNTQDISAKHYVTSVLGSTLGEGDGDTHVIPMANPDIEILFEKNQLDAAWVPEPWASRMVDKGLVTVVAEEKDLWPAKRFTLTNVIARRKFVEEHPDLVTKFLRAHLAVTDQLIKDRQSFAAVINSETKRITGKELPPAVIEASLKHIEFNVEPSVDSFESFFKKGKELGLLNADALDVKRLIDASFLAAARKEQAR